MHLCCQLLIRDRQLLEILATKSRVRHPFPFHRLLPPIHVSRDPELFVRRIKQGALVLCARAQPSNLAAPGVLQFTVIKPLMALLVIVLSATGSVISRVVCF